MRQRKPHPGPCFYCQSGREVDYKDTLHLKRFLTPRGRIRPRVETGLCAKHQRLVKKATKRARVAALLPFIEK